MRNRKQQGFSLIELLVVVAIILIIAAIAIPNLMAARMSANESSAAGALRTINTSEMSYAMTYPDLGFTDLPTLGGPNPCAPSPSSGCFVDNVLSSGIKQGYQFTVTPGTSANGTNLSYAALADPASLNSTGSRSFCTDQTGVLYYLSGATGCTTSTGSVLQ